MVNRGVEVVAWAAAAVGVAVLGVLVGYVARNGASKLNLSLFTNPGTPDAVTSVPQGLANAFAGSLVIVGIATAMALPFGILVAIYVSEFAPRAIKGFVNLVLDVVAGIPAIVVAISVRAR